MIKEKITRGEVEIKYYLINTLLTMLFISMLHKIVYAQTLTQKEILEIAQQEFEKTVPESIRSEYKLFGVSPNQGSYSISWWRYINGVLIEDDRFIVTISPTGSIEGRIYSYSSPRSELNTASTLTKNQVSWLVLNTYGGNLESTENLLDNPLLIIRDNKLMWAVVLSVPNSEGGNSILHIGLDPHTGETIWFDSPRGSEVQKLETYFNPTEYYIDVYGKYAVVVVITGGLIFWKRKDIFKLFRK